MEALADAASTVESPDASTQPDLSEEREQQPAAVAGAKRGRPKALEAAEKKVSAKRLKIAECEAKVCKLEALARPKAREKESLEKEKAKLLGLRDELVFLEQQLQEAQAKADC